MKNPLAKLFILAAILLAIYVIWRGFLHVPNDEVDSGLAAGAVQSGAVSSVSKKEYPSRLLIPKLGIDSKVQHVGLTRTGNMAAPNNFTDVSWYKYGTVPGLVGSAVMAGHVDNALGTPAIFYELKNLEVGDRVIVKRENGERLTFEVVDKEIHEYDKAPLKKIFNASDAAYLNLITCQGEWVPEAKSARYRLVVYTKLVE